MVVVSGCSLVLLVICICVICHDWFRLWHICLIRSALNDLFHGCTYKSVHMTGLVKFLRPTGHKICDFPHDLGNTSPGSVLSPPPWGGTSVEGSGYQRWLVNRKILLVKCSNMQFLTLKWMYKSLVFNPRWQIALSKKIVASGGQTSNWWVCPLHFPSLYTAPLLIPANVVASSEEKSI